MQNEFDFSGGLPISALDGMQRADEHADEDWKQVIDNCIVAVARKFPELTVDDVLDEYEQIPEARRPWTHTLAALGPRMLAAHKIGILQSTGRVLRSRRAVKHGIRHSVWASNLYK